MIHSKIIFCSDFSDNSRPAERYAVEYAKAFGADILVLHVVDSWAGFPAYDHGIPIDVREIVESMKQAAEAHVSSISGHMRNETTRDVHTRVSIGPPAEEILRVTAEESGDLIIMGTHGWTGIRHMLLGSVAEKVLRTAACPVLVVRAPHGD